MKRANMAWCVVAALLSSALVASILGCGGDAFCEVPEGDYNLTVTQSSGDCPQSIVEAIESGLEDDALEVDAPNNGCGDVAVTIAETDPESGCDITASGSAYADEDGISDFDMTLTLSGASCSLSCTHTMQIDAER